jgi:predicted HicB family RNase H-like nuclease
MQVKTFPLKWTEERHQKIRQAAKKADISINRFVEDAINEKIEKDNLQATK